MTGAGSVVAANGEEIEGAGVLKRRELLLHKRMLYGDIARRLKLRSSRVGLGQDDSVSGLHFGPVITHCKVQRELDCRRRLVCSGEGLYSGQELV